MVATDPYGKGWFAVEGMQKGDRTVDEQLIGLDEVMAMSPGSTVLDLGCAEGLISLAMQRRGAGPIHGIESVASRVEAARFFFEGIDSRFFVADCDTFHSAPPDGLLPAYDIVLVLSIAQKMRNPTAFITAAAQRASKVVALRLPAPVICDKRSGSIPVEVKPLLADLGFPKVTEAPGPRGEWVGIFSR